MHKYSEQSLQRVCLCMTAIIITVIVGICTTTRSVLKSIT